MTPHSLRRSASVRSQEALTRRVCPSVVAVGLTMAIALTGAVSLGACRGEQADQVVESRGAPQLVTATYWIRPYGDSRHVSVVGYDDPPSGNVPYVLYGSITNTGTATAESPTVEAVWRGADGAVLARRAGRVLDPNGSDLGALVPGGSADVLVVVSDETVAALIGAADPVLVGGAA